MIQYQGIAREEKGAIAETRASLRAREPMQPLGFRVWGLGLRCRFVGFRVWGLGFRVVSGLRIWCLGEPQRHERASERSRVWGLGLRV